MSLLLGEPDDAQAPRPERQIDLREYLYRLRRHWKLVVACVLLATAAGAVHFVITPKEYSATTTIQIERRSMGVAGSQMAWLENWWNMEYYPTQHQILRSRRLAEEVITKLRLMDDPKFNPRAGGESDGGGAEEDRAALARMALSLRSGLGVSPIHETQLVRLSYRHSDPEFAARVANGFAETFIDLGVETRTETVTQAQGFIAEQIEALRTEIADKEEQRRQLGQGSELILAADSEGVADSRLGSLSRELMTAKRERIEAQSRYEDLVSTSAETVATTYAGAALDPLQRELRDLEQEYRSQLDTFRPSYPPMVELQERIAEARDELAAATDREARRIVQTANRDYQAALRQESRLSQELERLREELSDRSSDAMRSANLRLEIENTRELLDELLRRQSETAVARRHQENRETNVQVIDQAIVPDSPSHPSLKKDLSMGLGVGLLLGLALVVLVEFLDRTVKSAEEAEKLLGLPVLAVIPDLAEPAGAGYRQTEAYGYGRKSEPSRAARRALRRSGADKKSAGPVAIELVPHARPRLAVSEGYRGLRTALLLSTADELKVVTVTSPGAGEGKTVTASNLAIVLAQLGRSVLLLDCDLRKPRLHKLFRLSNRQGMVTYLTGGREAELAAYPTDVPGLYVTPSGPTPPNPSELLASDRMAELLGGLRSRFDFVILDTPPVLPVTDAVLAGSLADGAVLCLRSGKVLRDDALACRDRLRRADVRVLGTVINGFRSQTGSGKRNPYYESYAYAEGAEAGSAA